MEEELRHAQIALTYLTEKRDGQIKSRTIYNRAPTCTWTGKEESASHNPSLVGYRL